jgi:hypothetical protein
MKLPRYDAAETWLQENDPEGVASNMRCWSEAPQAGARSRLVRVPVLQFTPGSFPRFLMFNR